jgi:penicillin-binding protein 2
MLRRAPEFRIAVLAVLMLSAVLLLTGRLWYVQVARGEEYTARIRSNSQVNVRLPSVRGDILDRHGVRLAENRSSMAVELYLPEVVRAYREEHGSVPQRTYQTTVRGMMTEKSEPDIIRILNETVIKRLADLGIAEDYNANSLRLHYRNNTEVPFTYIEDLDYETMARFAEHQVDMPGVNVTVRPVRRYTYGALGAHFLGYVGMPNEINKDEAARFTFYQPDVEGKAQLELLLDDDLRGEAGARIMQRDAKGKIQGEIERQEPRSGHNIQLTIDARIQYITEKALRVVRRGGAVVVDPNSGVLPALAGLRKGLGERSFTCSGGVKYGKHMLKCSGTHGSIGLTSALRVSCNSFFCLYGNNAGIEEINAVGQMLGLGQKSGAPIAGEYAGILPGPDWLTKQNLREQWSTGQTANTSIGQGFVLATPLQMAMVAATLGNWGTSYYPRLVDKVVAHDGTVVREEPVRIRAKLLENGFTVEGLDTVRRGLWDVVNRGGGTAPGARIKNYDVAGKTGTAQFWRRGIPDNHVWFISFAPYDKPRYAVCVMVNGGASGGGVAAPIASKILADIFTMEEGEKFEIASLEPAKGSFGYVSSVNFGRAIPAALADAPPGEGGTGDEGSSGSRTTAAAPTVKPAADAEGTVSKKNIFQRLFGGIGKKKKEG